MPQASSSTTASPLLADSVHLAEKAEPSAYIQSGVQLKSVMSELNRLSESFVNSYQTLETQVEKLNGQLKNEAEEKQNALQEKQQLLVEKASLSDRLQSLLAIMPAGVVVIDGNGKVKDCNAVAVDILGRPLLGQLWLTVINRAFDPQADDGHQVSLKDGRKIHIETRALDAEPGQIIVMTDLTKTRQLQAELSQQQKLSSMGKMIASLAHQIRTPLTAAILYGSHLKNPALASARKQEFSNHLMDYIASNAR
jgi:two-component system, sensor histidine kinase FlrB